MIKKNNLREFQHTFFRKNVKYNRKMNNSRIASTMYNPHVVDIMHKACSGLTPYQGVVIDEFTPFYNGTIKYFNGDVFACGRVFLLLSKYHKRQDGGRYTKACKKCCKRITTVGPDVAVTKFISKALSISESSSFNPAIRMDVELLYKSICLVHENVAIDVIAKYRRDLTREQIKELLDTTVWPLGLDFDIWKKCIELLQLDLNW